MHKRQNLYVLCKDSGVAITDEITDRERQAIEVVMKATSADDWA